MRNVGGEAVMTRPDHASGSDRVFEAVNRVDPDGDFEIILNLQGDLPAHASRRSRASAWRRCSDKGPDIATIAAEITNDADAHQSEHREGGRHADRCAAPAAGRSTSRAPRRPHGDGPLYHHFGMYAYRRSALERFVSLRPSTLEKREQLEQLRALEDGMRIDVTLVDSVPVEVNTPDDLERARRIISGAGRV